MAHVTVWLFDNRHAGAPVVGAGLRRRATQNAIEQNGLVPLENSAIEIDECFVNADGFTRREYVTFRIHVAHNHAYAGYASDGARLQLMAGDYDALLTLREFVAVVGAEDCLQVVGADRRQHGGDLWIKLSDYQYDLDRFPDEVPEQRLTVLGQRLTAAQEWDGL